MNVRAAGAGVALLFSIAIVGYWLARPAPQIRGQEVAAASAEAPPSLTSAASAASAPEDSAVAARPLPPAPSAVEPAPEIPFDEAGIMARLRAMAKSDPEGAIALAREGNVRFPDSADAPERASILIHALASVDRTSEARGEAENAVNHYPDSSWVREIESFTGAHRHRSIRLTEAGTLEYY